MFPLFVGEQLESWPVKEIHERKWANCIDSTLPAEKLYEQEMHKLYSNQFKPIEQVNYGGVPKTTIVLLRIPNSKNEKHNCFDVKGFSFCFEHTEDEAICNQMGYSKASDEHRRKGKRVGKYNLIKQ